MGTWRDGRLTRKPSERMIISASRRTDIPAFFSDWFSNRLAKGFCDVPNPFNTKQVRRVSLAPEDVQAFVFWTRHAAPFFPVLETLRQRQDRFYFHYTITGYGPPIEPAAPSLDVAIPTARRLAERLPPGAVVWRYDPILLGDAFPPSLHLKRFAQIAAALEGLCRRVVVSLMHPYRKTQTRVGRHYAWNQEVWSDPASYPGVSELISKLAPLAVDHGMTLEACATPHDWTALGVSPTRCIDNRLLSELYGGTWPDRRDPGQREACHCIPSQDIGMADTCGFGCLYCYSTRSDALALRRRQAHDPSAPSLCPLAPTDQKK